MNLNDKMKLVQALDGIEFFVKEMKSASGVFSNSGMYPSSPSLDVEKVTKEEIISLLEDEASQFNQDLKTVLEVFKKG